MAKSITYVEIDAPRCSLTYGVLPCTAAIGVTGDEPCYNTPGSCQAPNAYERAAQPMVLRWVTNSEFAPVSKLRAMPALESVDIQPQKINPGESLGRRERARCSIKNHPDSDVYLDPYPESRNTNPFNRGTHLGKLMARWPNMQGYPARVYRGILDETAADPRSGLEVLHYDVDKIEYNIESAEVHLVDGLAWIESTSRAANGREKALFPAPSLGSLSTDIGAGVGVTFEITPPGVFYPGTGRASIDKELVSYTRSGNTITLTGRGLEFSEVKTHKAGAVFQREGVLSGNVALVLSTLLLATDMPSAYRDLAAWNTEANTYAPEILDARIATPTPVAELVNRLIREMALMIWVDISARKLRMRVLRPFPPVGDINTRNAIGISPSRDSMHRVDSVYVRYGRINPLEKFDEAQNYYGGLYRVDDNPYQAIQDNPSAISRVYSIYIPTTLRSTADATAQVILSRYNRVMRRVVCALPAELAPQLGEVVNFSGPHFEMPNGEPDINIPMQCVARDRGEHQVKVELEEYRVTQARGGPVRVINIERNMVNVNLRGLYNATFGPTIAAGTQIIVQGDGVHGFGGTPAQNLGTAQPALSILASDWASDISRGVTIELRDLMIIGRSGTGGQPDPVSPSAFNGSAGRAGLLVQVPVAVSGGRIAGGGGGGGAAFAFGEIGQEGRYALGGLGAGSWGAEFFLTGSPGTTAVTPVETAIGGRGGELGMPGEPGVRSGGGNTGTGAPPGAAVIGYSHLTITGGTIINGSVSG